MSPLDCFAIVDIMIQNYEYNYNIFCNFLSCDCSAHSS